MTDPALAVFDWRQNQDLRSFDHLYEPEATASKLPIAYHRVMGPVIDQGQDGSCTGHGTAGMLGSHHPRLADHLNALAIYELATSRDPYPGDWPTSDGGSSVNAAMRACRDIHRVKSWTWIDPADPDRAAHLLVPTAIAQHNVVVIGAPWYASMDHVAGDGRMTVDPDSGERGGHCWAVYGYEDDDRDNRNSWGPTWGHAGDFVLTADGLSTLIENGAELAVASVW